MQKVKLNNGVEMPILGFGVFQVTRTSSFFDHRDPAMVKWLGNYKSKN